MAKKLTPGQIRAIQARVGRLEPRGTDDLVQGQEGNRRLNSGIMGDLFSVLSRPSAATAQAASYALDKDPKTDILQGLLEGISGKSDKHFAQVLDEQGIKNPIVKGVAGFGLDVALDPLTYVGIKGTKGISPMRARSQAVQNLDPTSIPRAGYKDAVAATAEALERANPSSLHMTFAGKRITPDITGPSKVANTLRRVTGGPEFDRNLVSKVFSREAELPGGLANDARTYEAASMADYEHHQKGLKAIFKDLTPEERELVSLDLEAGIKSATPLSTQKAKDNPYGFQSVGDFTDFARETFKRYYDDEDKLGLHKPGQYDPNYVYKFPQKGYPDQYPGAPAGAKAGKPVKPVDWKTYSLTDMQVLKMQPVMDISEMLRLRAATHYRRMGRAKFVKDATEQFGIKVTDVNREHISQLGWKPVENHVLNDIGRTDDMKGWALPEPVIKVLNQTEQVLSDGNTGSDFMKKYDAVMRQWKFFNTTVSPGYYIRNSFSDAIQNMADGVWNPERYAQSRRVLADVRAGHATSLVNEIMGDTGLAKTMPEGRFVKIGGTNIPTDEVYKWYLRSGSKSGMITTEVTRELDPLTRQGFGQYVDRSKKALGDTGAAILKAEGKAADFNNLREDFWRMGHFIDGFDNNVKKGMTKEAAAMEAGKSVRRYNIDYGQLSSTEQKYMRRVFPFYAWFRRNLPLQMQMLFTKPGFMAAYPKGQDLVQTLFSADDGEGDYMVPKWMRELGPVRLAMANNEGNFANKLARFASGAGSGEAVFAPMLSGMTPIGDLGQIAEPFQRGLETGSITEGLRSAAALPANMATPFIRAPYEAATGMQTFNQQKIDGAEGWRRWALSQLGAGGRGAAMAATGDLNESQLTSTFAGIQAQPVTAKRQKGEFRHREDVLRAQIDFAKTQRLQAMRRPVTPENKAKITTPKIKRLQEYLKWAGKSVGA